MAYALEMPVLHKAIHEDAIKWKHFPCYWPFVRGIHWWPVDSPHKGKWRRALMFSLICTWRNSWANNQDASDLRCHRAHNDVHYGNQSGGSLMGGWPLWPPDVLLAARASQSNPRGSGPEVLKRERGHGTSENWSFGGGGLQGPPA